MTSNAVPPSVTYPSPNEWPNTIRNITGITRDAQAVVTSPSHGFTSRDQGQTVVDFLQVKGMIQINGLPGTIQTVIDNDHFTVNINSTQFYNYVGGGYANIVAGWPPYDPYTNIANRR